MMELTAEQWKWLPSKVYLVVMLEIIKLLTSVIDIWNILTAIHNKLYKFMFSNPN